MMWVSVVYFPPNVNHVDRLVGRLSRCFQVRFRVHIAADIEIG